jgi:hypothetical protein
MTYEFVGRKTCWYEEANMVILKFVLVSVVKGTHVGP